MSGEIAPIHIRLPERSDSVEGREFPPGEASKPNTPLDPRTANQDPILPTQPRDG